MLFQLKHAPSFTEDPPWVTEMIKRLEPCRERVFKCRLLQEAREGVLPSAKGKAWFAQFYPFVQAFPQWLALNISKATNAYTRNFLIDMMRLEKNHAGLWCQMCGAAGISEEALSRVVPVAEVDALNHWMWSINFRGTLPESMSATNFALEGLSHDLAVFGLEVLPKYADREWVTFDEKVFLWAKKHAKYDRDHPRRVLELLKQEVNTKEMQGRIESAAKRSFEYMVLALEGCYEKATTI